MPVARRMTNRITDEERTAIRNEALADVRDALDGATDFEEFRAAMAERNPSALAYSDIAALTVDEVIERKEEVDRLLAQGPDPAPPADDGDDEPLPPAARRPTGQQLVSESGPAAPPPLTIRDIRKMTADEILARKGEVDAALARGQ